MIDGIVTELIFTHGTGPFLLFHIGEVPGFEGGPPPPSTSPTNRYLMQENLYALCLNAFIGSDDDDSGSPQQGP